MSVSIETGEKYLIQQIKIEQWGINGSSFWYEPHFIVDTKEEASEFCGQGGFMLKKDCYAIQLNEPVYIWQPVETRKVKVKRHHE